MRFGIRPRGARIDSRVTADPFYYNPGSLATRGSVRLPIPRVGDKGAIRRYLRFGTSPPFLINFARGVYLADLRAMPKKTTWLWAIASRRELVGRFQKYATWSRAAIPFPNLGKDSRRSAKTREIYPREIGVDPRQESDFRPIDAEAPSIVAVRNIQLRWPPNNITDDDSD